MTLFQSPPQQPYDGPLAESKPHVMCPAAMKCVPSEQCDFKGVMVEQPINYTPDLLMLRVQLNVRRENDALISPRMTNDENFRLV